MGYQMASNDLEQYAAVVTGVEEIVTIIVRYTQIEKLYQSRAETALKQDFDQHLVRLYKHIIRYQISATCYYQQNTMRESSHIMLHASSCWAHKACSTNFTCLA